MAQADIPVDLFNPGQVFACLGFLEAADIVLGDAEGNVGQSRTLNSEKARHFRLKAVLSDLVEPPWIEVWCPWPESNQHGLAANRF
jgi:CRISPR-associated protein Csb3